jgi:hypothetical protein
MWGGTEVGGYYLGEMESWNHLHTSKMGLASSYKFSVSTVIPFTLSLYMYYAYLSIVKISIQKLALYVYYFIKIDF